jgi:predicted transglutaminase-like cysteine proteinase
MLILASCSKPTVEPKLVPEEPVIVEERTPVKIPLRGIIPDSVIREAQTKYGTFAANRYRAYNAKLLELQNSTTEEKLEEINDFFNQVPHGEDIEVWGRNDYWATPLEFLGRDRGDCEDYVIAKYFALRDLGIATNKLYFSYVKSLRFNIEHMVLSYFETPTSVPLILDNTNFKIFPADQRPDLVPVYNFNMKATFRARKSGKMGERVEPRVRIKNHWERLIHDIETNKM